jgi:peptidoglycan/xylan/chitin deacetylase (PgdA/CDA1 family)
VSTTLARFPRSTTLKQPRGIDGATTADTQPSLLKALLGKLASSSLGWAATALVRGSGCFVLTYHRIGSNPSGFKHLKADLFRDQMLWVRDHCTPIRPEEIFGHTHNTNRRRPPIIVTFDDGYRDYYEVAYPILRELKIPAANFISTHYADTGDLFWWDVVDLAVAASIRSSVILPWANQRAIKLDHRSRQFVRAEVRRRIKSRPDAEREATLTSVLDALDVRRSDLRCERQVMTWDEIRSVREGTSIGAHSHTHPLLTRIDDAQLDFEVRHSRDRIVQELGTPPTLFAYPSGAFNAATKRVVRQYGFCSAFSTRPGVNNESSDWSELKRLTVPTQSSLLALSLIRVRAEVDPPAE